MVPPRLGKTSATTSLLGGKRLRTMRSGVIGCRLAMHQDIAKARHTYQRRGPKIRASRAFVRNTAEL
jgi:hypothetical protein